MDIQQSGLNAYSIPIASCRFRFQLCAVSPARPHEVHSPHRFAPGSTGRQAVRPRSARTPRSLSRRHQTASQRRRVPRSRPAISATAASQKLARRCAARSPLCRCRSIDHRQSRRSSALSSGVSGSAERCCGIRAIRGSICTWQIPVSRYARSWCLSWQLLRTPVAVAARYASAAATSPINSGPR